MDGSTESGLSCSGSGYNFAGEVIKRGGRESLRCLLDSVSEVSTIFFLTKERMFYMRR